MREPLRYDPEFKGPVHKRSCTDIVFLIIFLIFIGGWALVSVFAIKYGNPEQILYPSDSYGRICGRNELKNKPYLYFFNILKCAKVVKSIQEGCDTPQVCVEKCPNYTVSYVDYRDPEKFRALSPSEKEDVRSHLICMDGIEIEKRDLSDIPKLLKEKKCALFYFNSDAFAGRCVPKALKKLPGKENKEAAIIDDNGRPMRTEALKNISVDIMTSASKGLAFTMNARAIGEKIFHDIMVTWKYILTFLLIGTVVSFIWILLLQIIAGFMVWFSMFAIIVLTLISLYLCVDRYIYLGNAPSDELDEDLKVNVNNVDVLSLFKVQMNSLVNDRRIWLLFSIVIGVLSVILFLTFVFLRQRISIAIALIKEASKAISHAYSSLFFPLIPYIFQFLVIMYWGFIAILISASGRKTYRIQGEGVKDVGMPCNPLTFDNQTAHGQCLFYQHYTDNILTYSQLYNLFMALWILFFISGQVSLAGAFSTYYWAFRKPQDIPAFPVLTGAYRALRYHMGSIAFGSFLLATVRFIRIIIEWIESKVKRHADSAVAKAIFCLCRCCFWMLESFLRFINTNAYIMIAIYGENFCSSARNAFMLLMRNILRVLVLDKVADYLLFLGKLVVTATMGILSFYYFTRQLSFEDVKYIEPPILNYYWVPIAVSKINTICFGTYLIASSFFAVYDMTVDTIFLCFRKLTFYEL
ncbi:hypothetical protein B4U80_08103, partial [Leptotrombidium deliense]